MRKDANQLQNIWGRSLHFATAPRLASRDGAAGWIPSIPRLVTRATLYTRDVLIPLFHASRVRVLSFQYSQSLMWPMQIIELHQCFTFLSMSSRRWLSVTRVTAVQTYITQNDYKHTYTTGISMGFTCTSIVLNPGIDTTILLSVSVNP